MLCGSRSETHCKDLKPQIEEVKREGCSVVIKEEIEVRAEEENDELCMVCGLGENEDDEEGELWVECTRCWNWTHKMYPRKLWPCPF